MRSKTLLAIALALSALLVACGDDNEAGDANTPVAGPAMVATPTAAAQPTPVASATALETDGNAPGIPELRGEIITTPSGLRYIDELVGTGPSPQTGQDISVHYTGWFVDGIMFDTSRDGDGQPIVFPLGVGGLIKGWEEALPTMQVGGKRRLIVPPNLAYGPEGRGPIPPDATLIFDVELIAAE